MHSIMAKLSRVTKLSGTPHVLCTLRDKRLMTFAVTATAVTVTTITTINNGQM